MEGLFVKMVGGSAVRGRIVMGVLVVFGLLYMGFQLFRVFNKPIDEKYYYDSVTDTVDDAANVK